MAQKPPVHNYPVPRDSKADQQYRRMEARVYNLKRPDSDRFYSKGIWKRTRAWFIRHNPTCKRCESNGIVTAATVVDHIIPRKAGGASLDQSNLQALCHACHNAKTAEDASKYGAGGV